MVLVVNFFCFWLVLFVVYLRVFGLCYCVVGFVFWIVGRVVNFLDLFWFDNYDWWLVLFVIIDLGIRFDVLCWLFVAWLWALQHDLLCCYFVYLVGLTWVLFWLVIIGLLLVLVYVLIWDLVIFGIYWWWWFVRLIMRLVVACLLVFASWCFGLFGLCIADIWAFVCWV